MNVLVATAHHDDLELGCGATVAKLTELGHRVVSLVMTHSGYSGPDGASIRARHVARNEAARAAQILGYELISLEEDTFDIAVTDANVRAILRVVEQHQIDTVLTHWHGDTHPPHQRVHVMAVHASRHLPRVMGFAVNWYLGERQFDPRVFVSVDDSHWERKIRALECYESEYRRAGSQWVQYLDRQTLNFGAQLGVRRAEGFVVYRSLWEIATTHG